MVPVASASPGRRQAEIGEREEYGSETDRDDRQHREAGVADEAGSLTGAPWVTTDGRAWNG